MFFEERDVSIYSQSQVSEFEEKQFQKGFHVGSFGLGLYGFKIV